MIKAQVVGSGPVPFAAGGKFYLIPLSSLDFTDGKIDSTRWLTAVGLTADKAPGLTERLAALAAGGVLRADTRARPAVVFKAAADADAGNNVAVVIKAVTPGATAQAAKLDLTVVETAAFDALSTKSADPTYVGTLLDAAKKPRLVKFDSAPGGTVGFPKDAEYTSDAATGKIEVKKADNTAAFTLAVADDKKAPPTVVTVTGIDATAGTFGIAAKRTAAVTAAALGDLLDPAKDEAKAIAHAVKVELPDAANAGSLAVPAVGTVVLAGGRKAFTPATVPAEKATATAYTTPG